jgi:protocatechuate 3,4-dioxygenase beta subunit
MSQETGTPSPSAAVAPYASAALRAPSRLLTVPPALWRHDEPVYPSPPAPPVTDLDADLTRGHGGEPIGERIIVSGQVRDGAGRPVRDTIIEIWQANAAGRYVHAADQHPAPVDPHFTGTGRCVTDAQGRYEFTTIKPGAYPWRNHDNAWRPAHIHLSLLGPVFATRLVTQMYFPGDPLIATDPIAQSIRDPRGRAMLISELDGALTRPEWALGYRFDIVVGGRDATPTEH